MRYTGAKMNSEARAGEAGFTLVELSVTHGYHGYRCR